MGCGCLIALLGLISPRLVIFLLWLFSDRLTIAFDSFVIGFLGFLLLPFTTLFYALAYEPVLGVTGFGWILVGFGVLLDLSSWFAGGDSARRRQLA